MNHHPPSKSLPHSHSSSAISSPSPSTSSPPILPIPPQAPPPLQPSFPPRPSFFPFIPPRPPPSLPNDRDRTTSATSAIYIHTSPTLSATSSPSSSTFALAMPCPSPPASGSSSSAPPARPSPFSPTSATAFFSSFAHLNLSLLFPWGHPLPPPLQRPRHQYRDRDDGAGNDEEECHLIVRRLHRAFSNLTSFIVYACYSSTLDALLPLWGPRLYYFSLVCRHRCPHINPSAQTPSGSSAPTPLFCSFPASASLDLSCFYC